MPIPSVLIIVVPEFRAKGFNLRFHPSIPLVLESWDRWDRPFELHGFALDSRDIVRPAAARGEPRRGVETGTDLKDWHNEVALDTFLKEMGKKLWDQNPRDWRCPLC